MTHHEPFPAQELDSRLAAVRKLMAERQPDGLVVAVPENIYYLTGLDHWGFFACHVLIVPLEGEMTLVARAMERVTVTRQVKNAAFIGHGDDEEPAEAIVAGLKGSKLDRKRLGMEKRSLFLTPHIAELVVAKTPAAAWEDVSGLIDDIRLVKSPLEIEYTRKAAAAADAGTRAGIAAAHEGASDLEIAAEVHRAMILAGSEYPGFGPFVRPTARLNEEHTTWKGDVFAKGDAVYMELSASFRRYHAPMGRLVYLGEVPKEAWWAADVSDRAMNEVLAAIKPGATAGSVYQAWQDVVDDAGLSHYRRHHCGYLVGIGFPPSWCGGGTVTSLAPGSDLELRTGMVFHLHSWLMCTGRGDYFFSNTAVLTENGCEILTNRTPETLQVV